MLAMHYPELIAKPDVGRLVFRACPRAGLFGTGAER
jgi:hypothetical protein